MMTDREPRRAVFFLRLLLVVCALAFAANQARAAGATRAIRPVSADGVTNVFQLSTKVFSGSAPEGPQGFDALRKLGITTVISVDGVKPDVETAHRFGLRYVHLPHGYDGIDAATQARLIKAAETSPGPVYVHCHHGQHRGPAAAAVICMSRENWPAAEALEWLHRAGTSSNYAGLFETVRRFRSPSAAELQALPSSFPEVAHLDDLVETMVGIDQTWDHLKELRKSGYVRSETNPDATTTGELLLLLEHFREAQRLSSAAQHGADFMKRLKAAEESASAACVLAGRASGEQRGAPTGELDRALDQIAKSCQSCHSAYRDKPKN